MDFRSVFGEKNYLFRRDFNVEKIAKNSISINISRYTNKFCS